MPDQHVRPFAVVTGGSSGIGFELARQFAGNGYDVLIASEQEARLEAAAERLRGSDATITMHAADLAQEAGVDSLYAAIAVSGRSVDVLCVNAGIGLGGPFVETDLATELRMIDLNCRGAVQLTKLVLKDMVARDAGKLLFTSSIAATMPDPFEAVYGSTKVFLRWFGEALRNELKETNIGVTVLMPSVTDTNFFVRADMLDTRAGASETKDDPALVAKAAYDALMADRDKVVPLAKNKVMAAIADALPDRVAAQLHRGMAKPGTAPQPAHGPDDDEEWEDEGRGPAPFLLASGALLAGVALSWLWIGRREPSLSERTRERLARYHAPSSIPIDPANEA